MTAKHQNPRDSSDSTTPVPSTSAHEIPAREGESDPLNRDELAATSKQYAHEVQMSHSDSPVTEIDLGRVDWRASSQLCRFGAYCETKLDDPPRHTIVLSYPGYRAWGWNRMAGVVRHELAHVVVNEQFGGDVQPHGPEFQEVAESLDAPMQGEDPVPYRYKLFCSQCGSMTDGLYQASDRTENPWHYDSPCCQAPLQVEKEGEW